MYADQSLVFNTLVTEICQAADQNSVVSHDRLEDIIQSFDYPTDD